MLVPDLFAIDSKTNHFVSNCAQKIRKRPIPVFIKQMQKKERIFVCKVPRTEVLPLVVSVDVLMRLTGEENIKEIYKIREESNGINNALAG